MVEASTDVDGADEVAAALEAAANQNQDEVGYAVRTMVPYAYYQEFGTSFHRHSRISARPSTPRNGSS